jgi:hypothetical protein
MNDDFARWLAAALAPTPKTENGTIRVEDHQRWSDEVASATGPDRNNELRAAFNARLNGPKLTAADRAAAIATAMAKTALDILPDKFTPAGRGDFDQALGTELSQAVDEEASRRAGRARLVWLLRSVRHRKEELGKHLSSTAALALEATDALAENRPLPPPEKDGGPFLQYLRQLAVPPRPPVRPWPRFLEVVREFCGGNRFEFTRTGIARGAILIALLVIFIIATVVYGIASRQLSTFRTDNRLPAYEKSLIGK